MHSTKKLLEKRKYRIYKTIPTLGELVKTKQKTSDQEDQASQPILLGPLNYRFFQNQ